MTVTHGGHVRGGLAAGQAATRTRVEGGGAGINFFF